MLVMPLLGALAVALLRRDQTIRTLALVTTCVTFCLSLLMVVRFDFGHSGRMQMSGQLHWVSQFGLHFSFGVDAISLWLVLLTTFLSPLVILSSFTAIRARVKEYYLWLLVLQTAMMGVFVANDLIFFYLCFEFTLVPMYFLIGIYGSSQRLKAAKVFFLYTFTGSMLTFAGILYVAWWVAQQEGTWSFDIQFLIDAASDPAIGLSTTQQVWVMLALMAGFAVKVPLFPVHTWLPLAHTEAPTGGSVVLAGVLLKLGTYAILRLAIPLTPDAAYILAPYIAVIAVIGILYTALICWVQKDLKKLIAYSSVSHLGFCVLGMFALNVLGMSGSVMYMVNHGLATGALFLCVGMIYERFHTRQMQAMSGLGRVMPVWATFMVFFCLASVGLPGLNNFVSEFLTLMGAFTSGDVLGPAYAAAAGVGMIFGAIYILYMVGKVVFGPVKIPPEHGPGKVKDLTPREIVVLVPLAIACLWLGLYPKPVLRSLDRPIEKMVAHVAPAQMEAGRVAGALGKLELSHRVDVDREPLR